MVENTITSTCCIVGGGPAGMMLGYLLARAGVDVVVLEKHGDFLRDFRGDTVHPSTVRIMGELGLMDKFLALPHDEHPTLFAQFGTRTITMADFTHIDIPPHAIVFMPQWDFLDFLADQAKRFHSFSLRMNAEVESLIEEDGRVVGVRAQTRDGPVAIRAKLTVAADGRTSRVRDAATLAVRDIGAPIDVLWFRLSRAPSDPAQPFGTIIPGKLGIAIERREHYQCGIVVAKGGYDEVRREGLDQFRRRAAELFPHLADRVNEISDWDDVKLLTVAVNRLDEWAKPGLLCIGDAAHAMSPVGGVGINLAIQDAVATANLLAVPLARGETPSLDLLRKVQHRREFPTRATQRMQVAIQNQLLMKALDAKIVDPPWFLRLADRSGLLRRLTARFVGIGVRPEHVKSPAVTSDRPA